MTAGSGLQSQAPGGNFSNFRFILRSLSRVISSKKPGQIQIASRRLTASL
jgi:hypothetical protein